MAHVNKDTSPNSLDAILRGLTQRPNVESTLILSRKNGSVIKAIGFLDQEDDPETSQEPSRWGEKALIDTQTNKGDTAGGFGSEDFERQHDISTVRGTATRTVGAAGSAERLAASIFQFVQSATLLSLSMNSQPSESKTTLTDHSNSLKHEGGVSSKSSGPVGDLEEELVTTRTENNVQLLRLRTKIQEIIIYPDSNYLCCVVQRIGHGLNIAN